jgi:hypothetical protein
MAKLPVIIAVEDPKDLSRVRDKLESHGLTQVSTLQTLGILKGLAHPDSIAAMAKVDGVRSVEKEREIKLPPPGSRVQ